MEITGGNEKHVRTLGFDLDALSSGVFKPTEVRLRGEPKRMTNPEEEQKEQKGEP